MNVGDGHSANIGVGKPFTPSNNGLLQGDGMTEQCAGEVLAGIAGSVAALRSWRTDLAF